MASVLGHWKDNGVGFVLQRHGVGFSFALHRFPLFLAGPSSM